MHLTKSIIRELIHLRKNVSVLTSSNNKEYFFDILDENKIISFEAPAFDKNIVQKMLEVSDKKYNFDLICIPNIENSNNGYENVFDVAKIFNIPVIKISEKGKIVLS
jgi:hypothetical protein